MPHVAGSARAGAVIAEPAETVPPIDGVTVVRDGEYTISNARPLEQAAKLLERKLGVPIWYEDPPWTFSGDLVEAADLPANRELAARYPRWRGPLVPRGGSMLVTLPTSPAVLKTEDPVTLLQAAIDSHKSLNNSADFKVVQFGDNEFSIVGTHAAGKDGRVVEQIPPLDRRVSFPEAERTEADTLNLICRTINVELMVQFTGGSEKSRRMRIGANNEVARDLLARIVKVPGAPKVSWVLSYMPDLQRYLLGLRSVEAEIPVPGGGTQLKPVLWPK